MKGKERKMVLEEINPELFTLELYNAAGVWQLDAALYAADSFGFCDASRLAVRPRTGEFALMVEWTNGAKYWFHVDSRQLALIKRRLQRRQNCNAINNPKEGDCGEGH